MTEKSEKHRFGKISALLFTIVFMAFYFYGIRAVSVAGVSVFSSVLADYFACTAMRKKYDWADLSPVMSGLLLALLMPASVPYTIMAFAAAFMAIVCKHAFGGNRNLIFCPVCIAYIFTTFCFPSETVRYPLPTPFGSVSLDNIVSDTLTRSYTYYLDSGASSTFSLLDIIWGKLAGPMGASAILIILICAVALYFFGDIPATAFFAGFGANVLINVLFPVGESGWYAVLNSLVAGSYFFALVFLACDPRYVPKRQFSQAVYGIAFAGASYLIRMNTGIENGAIFALPLLCVFRDEFDRLTDALEKLIKFIWKWIKILSVRFAKLVAKGLDAFCELVATWINDMLKKRAEKKAAELLKEENKDAEASDSEEPSEDMNAEDKSEESVEDAAVGETETEDVEQNAVETAPEDAEDEKEAPEND